MRRIGLIGFGSIAENGHLPAWQSFEDVEVVAVAEVSPERLDRARTALPGAVLYDSPLELLARADVDGIDICTPPNTHAELILAACRQGLADIVCEKPLVLSEEEYVRVAHARAASGSRVISVNNWIHSDLNRHVVAALDGEVIGTVQSVELRIGRPGCALGNSGWRPAWRTDVTYSGGGIILDHGWHQLYLLLGWMRAPVESVSAVTRTANRRHYPVEDEALINMQFPDAYGRIELSWTAAGRTNGGMIRGSRGTIAIHDDRVVIDNGAGEYDLPFLGKLSESSYHPDWFRLTFRSNVLDESRDEADRNFGEAGVLVSAIRACYRSAQESGQPCRPTFPTEAAVQSVMARETEAKHVCCGSGGEST